MSDLWWLDKGWTSATCPNCGRNIWDSGGDPDMGICYDCFSQQYDERIEQIEPPPLICEICSNGQAVTQTNGYCVCSEQCDREAQSRNPKTIDNSGQHDPSPQPERE